MNLKDQFVKERNMGIIPMEMTFKDYVDMQVDLSQTYQNKGNNMTNYNYGGRAGYLSGGQAKLDVAAPFGTLNAKDFSKLREEASYGGRMGYALGGNNMMQDSRQGLGSMMANEPTGGDPYKDMQVPTDMLEDPEGRMQSDEQEMIRQIMQSGQLAEIKNGLSPEQLSDIGAMYDSAVQDGRFNGDFDEFLATIVLQQAKQSSGRGEGIMSTMRG